MGANVDRCIWCGKRRRKWSEWEQKKLGTEEYFPLCNYCVNQRWKSNVIALIPMRKRLVDTEAAATEDK